MKAKKEGNGPKRSILFLHVTGEEHGLHGSRFYSENPLFPLKNTIADINIDMISMPPNHGANAGLSFTISDQDLIEVLSFANTLKTETGTLPGRETWSGADEIPLVWGTAV